MWAVLTESLISELCKLGPDFFKDGKGDKKCSASHTRNPLLATVVPF